MVNAPYGYQQQPPYNQGCAEESCMRMRMRVCICICPLATLCLDCMSACIANIHLCRYPPQQPQGYGYTNQTGPQDHGYAPQYQQQQPEYSREQQQQYPPPYAEPVTGYPDPRQQQFPPS